MTFVLITIVLIAVLYGPTYWARHVLNKYNRREYFSGTGLELAQLLLDRMALSAIRVEASALPNHYDPTNKTVRLNHQNSNRRSLTAVVAAAHEVAHAVQHHTGYTPMLTRQRWIGAAHTAEKIGAGLLMAMPLITLVTRVPATGAIMFICGLAVIGLPVLIHLVTLPVEFDASFRRALPMLTTGKYIPPEDVPAARRILLACALTYVAHALSGLLNVWRWIRILRR